MTREEYIRLTDLYLTDIYRVAYSGCRNSYDAEDITQEVFEALFRYPKAFESDLHAKRWLIRVTLNKCKSMWRTPWKRRVDLSENEIEDGEDQVVLWENAEQEKLYSALRKLPLKYAQIIHLYYFEDMKAKDIADLLHISESAASTRLKRGRDMLKKFMEGEAYE